YKLLAARFREFRIFISTPMECGRPWPVRWEGLHVERQKCITMRGSRKHPHGFSEDLQIHLPYDTVSRLHEFRPDLVISAEMGGRTAQAALYRVAVRNCRLIVWATVSEYTEMGRGFLRFLLRRSLLSAVDAFIVNGRSGERYIRRLSTNPPRI